LRFQIGLRKIPASLLRRYNFLYRLRLASQAHASPPVKAPFRFAQLRFHERLAKNFPAWAERCCLLYIALFLHLYVTMDKF
ncbi:MAG: hypothetical protein K2O14_13935, partial [Oscillospiraceae bacterium]|nr:hypothetical protein [Oscillospiraceae bacterium]